MKRLFFVLTLLSVVLFSCSKEDVELVSANTRNIKQSAQDEPQYTPEEMAELLTAMELSPMVVAEIHQTIVEYTVDGYDEYVDFRDIIATEVTNPDIPQPLPSPGIGGSNKPKNNNKPNCPLFTQAIVDYFQHSTFSMNFSAEEIINLLKDSELELYWPYSELWDGQTLPSYGYVNSWSYDGDVLDGFDYNGYGISIDETYAMEYPVFIIRPKSKSGVNDGLSGNSDDNLSDWEEGNGDSDDDQNHNPVGGEESGGGHGWFDPEDGGSNDAVLYYPVGYKYKLLLTDIQILKSVESLPFWKGGATITIYNFAPKSTLSMFEEYISKVAGSYTFSFTRSQIARRTRYTLKEDAKNNPQTLGLNNDWDFSQKTNAFVCVFKDPDQVTFSNSFFMNFSTQYRRIVNNEEVISTATGGLGLSERDKILEEASLEFEHWNRVNKRYITIANGLFRMKVEIIETPR